MKSELTPFIVFATIVTVITAVMVWVVPVPDVVYSPIVLGDNTTIIADNGITLDNLVVNDTLMVGGVPNPYIEKAGGTMTGDLKLGTDIKLLLNTGGTVGFYAPTWDDTELVSVASDFYLASKGTIFINANTGADGGGTWLPSIGFESSKNLVLDATGGRVVLKPEVETSGIIWPTNTNTKDLGTSDKKWRSLYLGTDIIIDGLVDNVDVGSHDHSGGDMGVLIAGIASGLQAGKPTGTFAGQVYFATDTDNLWIYNGTAWVYMNLSS